MRSQEEGRKERKGMRYTSTNDGQLQLNGQTWVLKNLLNISRYKKVCQLELNKNQIFEDLPIHLLSTVDVKIYALF